MSKLACGIDLGGTNLHIGITDNNGNIIIKEKYSTEPEKGPESVIERIRFSVKTLLHQSSIESKKLSGIGIGVPGFIDTHKGNIVSLPNLPGWENIPLVKIMEEYFRITVIIDNDAGVATYGEYLFGSGQSTKNFFYMTVSTGIGGGVIIEGKPYRGTNFGAAEIGHITVDAEGEECKCGNFGCLEAMASGTAIVNLAKKAIYKGEKSMISDMAAMNCIKAEHIFDAADMGDELASNIINKEAFYLGIGVCNIIAMYNPERIAIGGGVSNQWNILYPKIMETVKAKGLKHNARVCDIVRAELGEDAGIIGAAALVLR